MGATLKDVARKAGVSAATVSRVLQDHPRISRKTKQLVLACVNELGYTVNNVARSLKTSHSRTIGFVCPELTNSFFMQVAKGVEDELRKAGISLILCNSREDPLEEAERLQLLLAQCVDGIILIPATRSAGHLQAVRTSGVPVVTVDRTFDDWQTDAVLVDNRGGSKAATEALLRRGYRRIAYIGGDLSLLTARERDLGYREAFAQAGLSVDETLIRYGDFHVESGSVLMGELMGLSNPPRAVFLANYFMYLGAVRWLLEHRSENAQPGVFQSEGAGPGETHPIGLGAGNPFGRTIALANFDNLEHLSVFGGSDVVVEQPMQELGQQAAALLLRRIGGDRQGFPESIRLGTRVLLSPAQEPSGTGKPDQSGKIFSGSNMPEEHRTQDTGRIPRRSGA